jgi:hypothetical protein
MRRTPAALGLMQVIREELAKAFAVARYDTSQYTAVVTGTDSQSEAEAQRQAKIREAYAKASASPPREEPSTDARISASKAGNTSQSTSENQQDQQHQQQVPPDPEPEPATLPTWAERWAKVKNELMATFGPKAGVAAVIDHCTKAHAAEVAVDLDIDVKSVQVRSEHAAVGQGATVVGYIDAPAATQEEVHIFAERLTKACPAARTYGDVEWRRGPPPLRK